jgi:soluble lytic murein transglycosylase-like protein
MKWDGPVTLLDEESNVTMGVRYLAFLRDKYNGDLQKMLAAYNCGPAKVDENMAVGRNVAMDYYNKVKQYFPRLALAGPKQVALRSKFD